MESMKVCWSGWHIISQACGFLISSIGVQVVAAGSSHRSVATILHKPPPMPPATTYALLGAHQPALMRQAAVAGLWSMRVLRKGLAAFDRTNESGIEDAVLVREHPSRLNDGCCAVGPSVLSGR